VNKLTELQLTKQVRDTLKIVEKTEGVYWDRNHQTLGMRRGRPDFELVINGQFTAIELKVGKGKLSKDQLREKERVQKAAGLWFTCYSLDDFIAVLKRFHIRRFELAV
jgi:hypothetical protein